MRITIIEYQWNYRYDQPYVDGYLISVVNNGVLEHLREYRRKCDPETLGLIQKSKRLTYSSWLLVED